jgi:2-C-methyl-D-erythritol 4-phosphate cytidylyltransferase
MTAAAGVLVCAGAGVRMGGPGDKLQQDLGGRPVVEWALGALVAAGLDPIVVVASERNIEWLVALIERTEVEPALHLILGGARRQDSVRAALEYLATTPAKSAAGDGGAAAGRATTATPPELVLIHDGARPLAGAALLARVLEGAREDGAATAALPLRDACKETDGEGFVRRSLERATLVAVQTPQAFRFETLLRAHREGSSQGAVVDDDAELVERLGLPVRLVEGEARNLKVTTAEDLAMLRALLG